MHEVPDRELYLRCCQGEEEAWRYLYGYVLAIARWTRWGLGTLAEDMAQVVLVSLMERGLATVRSADSFRSFVKRTTVNRILDHFRSGEVRFRHRPRASDESDSGSREPLRHYPDQGPAVDQQVAVRRDLARWMGLLEVLPGYCKGVLRAYMEYRLGLLESYRDIARQLGRPLNTVSVQIKRCLEQLRRAADQAGIVEPH